MALSDVQGPQAAARARLAGLRWTPLLLAAAAALVFQLAMPVNHDTAWYLDATSRLLEGAALYRDVFEVNPPLAFLLTLPPTAVAGLLGADPVTAFVVFVTLLVGLSLLLCRRVLRAPRPHPDERLAYGLILGLGLALFLAPLREYGQREHLMLILAAPYLLLAGLRADGTEVPRPLAVAVGLLAALGVALKPHFLLMPLLLELWVVCRRRRLTALFRPETLAAAGLLAAYPLAVAVLTPDYFETIVPFALEVYAAYQADWDLVLRRSLRLMVCAVLLGGLLLLPRPAEGRGLVDAQALAAVAFFAAFLAQHKGWTYHSYPSYALLLSVTVVLACTAVPAARGLLRRAGASVALVLILAVLALEGRLERWVHSYHPEQTAVRAAAERSGASRLYVFSANLWSTYPWVLDSGLRPVMRYPGHWLVPGLVRARWAGRDSPELDRIERYWRDSVVEDFARHAPDLVLVDVREDKPYFEGRTFDYLALLDGEPRFERLWRGYALVGEVEGYAFYRPLGTAQ